MTNLSYVNSTHIMELMKWSKTTLWRRIKYDKFPHIVDGKKYLFDMNDVEIWIKKRKVNAA